MGYTVDLTAVAAAARGDPYLSDRLLTALEKRAVGLVASQDIEAGSVSASLGVEAADAVAAVEVARAVFVEALAEALGGRPHPTVFTDVRAALDREEAATLA